MEFFSIQPYLTLVFLLILSLLFTNVLYDSEYKKVSISLIFCFLCVNIDFYSKFIIAIFTLDSTQLQEYSIDAFKLALFPNNQYIILTLFIFCQTLAYHYQISFCLDYKRLIMHLQMFYLILELPKFEDFSLIMIILEILLIHFQVYIEFFELSMEIELGLAGFLTGLLKFWVQDWEIEEIFSIISNFVIWPGCSIAFFIIFWLINFGIIVKLKDDFVKICNEHKRDKRSKLLWIFFDQPCKKSSMYFKFWLIVVLNVALLVVSRFVYSQYYIVATLSGLLGFSMLLGLVIMFDRYKDSFTMFNLSTIAAFFSLVSIYYLVTS